MEKRYLNILVCPNCKGRLSFDEIAAELVCDFDKLAFPVQDGIAVMIIDQARQIMPASNP
jgi:uncharacterized protein YbaR (Trm112 family)